MRHIAACAAGVVMTVALVSCGHTMTVEVRNPLPVDRSSEMVELALDDVTERVGGRFVISGDDRDDIPYQVTSDRKVIFPVDIAASSSARFHIHSGEPALPDVKVYGRQFPERKDDMAWENDKSAYRAYGPALQRSGERAFGYDIWTKSVDTLILEQRFRDDIERQISFHVDHGNGMDVYSVGPTLGGGTAALLDSTGGIVYPYCYENYEIVDNGPLRFTVRLTYGPLAVDGDSAVVENRLITLDLGSYLNRTEVTYSGLSSPHDVAAGIVLHRQNPHGYASDNENRFIAYADSTDNADNGNGVIYIGAVVPGEIGTIETRCMDNPAGDAIGHILAVSRYEPDSKYTYYWGSGWSKADMPDFQDWQNYLADFSRRLAAPLEVTVK